MWFSNNLCAWCNLCSSSFGVCWQYKGTGANWSISASALQLGAGRQTQHNVQPLVKVHGVCIIVHCSVCKCMHAVQRLHHHHHEPSLQCYQSARLQRFTSGSHDFKCVVIGSHFHKVPYSVSAVRVWLLFAFCRTRDFVHTTDNDSNWRTTATTGIKLLLLV